MNLKKTKRPIMGLAAFLIILFHLYPVPRGGDFLSAILRFVITTAYVGVDIFFFMAGYMAYFSDTKDYKQYIKRKFLNIYPIFILLSLIYFIMGKIKLTTMFKTLLGLELFKKGGGSLLWFVPSILIFYLLVPFIKKGLERHGPKFLTLVLAAWLAIVLIMENTFINHSINIFLARIPIILIGMSLAKYEGSWDRKKEIIIGGIVLAIGLFLTINYGYIVKKNILITDSFYILAIPYCLGLLLVLDVIFARVKSMFFDNLGKISLEMYCIQMVLGFYFFNIFSKVIKDSRIIFVFVFLAVVTLSFFLKFVKKSLGELIRG